MLLRKILPLLIAAVLVVFGGTAQAAPRQINCMACRKDPALVQVLSRSKVMANGVTSDFNFSVRSAHLNGKYTHSEYLAILAAQSGSFSHGVELKNWVGVNYWFDRFGGIHVYSNFGNGLYSSAKDHRSLIVDIAYTSKRAYMFRCGEDNKSCYNFMDGPPPARPKVPGKRYRKIRFSIAKSPQCVNLACKEYHSPANFPFNLRDKGQSTYLAATVSTDSDGYCGLGYELNVEIGITFVKQFDVCELLSDEQKAAGWAPLSPNGVTQVTVSDASPDHVIVNVVNLFRHKPLTKTWKLVFPKKMICTERNCMGDHYDSEGFSFYRWEAGVAVGNAYQCDIKTRQFEVEVTQPGAYSFREELSDAQVAAGYEFFSARETLGVTTVTITENSPSVVYVEIVNLYRHSPPPVVRQPPPPYVPPTAVRQPPLAAAPLPYNGGNGYIRTQQSQGPSLGLLPVQKIRCVRHGRLQCNECPKPPSRPPGNIPRDVGQPPTDPRSGRPPTMIPPTGY